MHGLDFVKGFFKSLAESPAIQQAISEAKRERSAKRRALAAEVDAIRRNATSALAHYGPRLREAERELADANDLGARKRDALGDLRRWSMGQSARGDRQVTESLEKPQRTSDRRIWVLIRALED